MLEGNEGKSAKKRRDVGMGKKRKAFFEDRGIKLKKIKKEKREEIFDFYKGEERNRKKQREERRERIQRSKENKWYQRVKREKIPEYLRKGWAENKWKRVAKYRLGEGMRKRNYWTSEENRKCRMCGMEEESWEHVWEECGSWKAERSWEEIVERVLVHNGEEEEWLRKLE
ncbi:protein PXR1-like [Solenopsis invicta]|nr:protein PXR1-like [Solenopsis invicta]